MHNADIFSLVDLCFQLLGFQINCKRFFNKILIRYNKYIAPIKHKILEIISYILMLLKEYQCILHPHSSMYNTVLVLEKGEGNVKFLLGELICER